MGPLFGTPHNKSYGILGFRAPDTFIQKAELGQHHLCWHRQKCPHKEWAQLCWLLSPRSQVPQAYSPSAVCSLKGSGLLEKPKDPLLLNFPRCEGSAFRECEESGKIDSAKYRTPCNQNLRRQDATACGTIHLRHGSETNR